MKSILLKFVLITKVSSGLFSIEIDAQISINEAGISPDASAVLDISSTEKGLLIPRMNSSSRLAISNPAEGLLVYDNSKKIFYYYTNSTWQALGYSVFDISEGVVHPGSSVDLDMDDFVFGSSQKDYDGNSNHASRFFFDKSKSAFRAGFTSGENWDVDSLGTYSFATGYDTKVTGSFGAAFGQATTASGDHCLASGFLSKASGEMSTATGFATKATGEYSTAMGSNTTASGSSSVALGSSTLASGDYSTAMGEGSNATASQSTAIGNSAVASGNNSNSFGYQTTASGNWSTAIGDGATASGAAATALGSYANAVGVGSMALGKTTVAGGNYSTAMGANTTAPSSYETTIGRYNTTYTPLSTTAWFTTDRLFTIGNGNQSSNPSDAMIVLKNGHTTLNNGLEVNTTDESAGAVLVEFNSSSDRSLKLLAPDIDDIEDPFVFVTPNAIQFRVDSDDVITIDAEGEVGIGTSNPFYALQVGNSGDGTSARGNAWNTFSDRRWKKDFKVIPNALEKLHQVNGYFYHWKEGEDTSQQTGVIAQEIEVILPQCVSTDENGYKSVDYGKLTAWLIQVNKEQEEVIEKLRNVNENYETRILRIEAMLRNN